MTLSRINVSGSKSGCRLIFHLLSEGKDVRLEVTGTSMAPSIKSGDRVVVSPASPDSVAIGDIVFFRQAGDRMALHRVLWVIRDDSGRVSSFLTKGDAVDTPDTPVMAEDIMGRVVRLEKASPCGVRRRRFDSPFAVKVSRITGAYHLARSNAVRFLVACKSGNASTKTKCMRTRLQSRHILHFIHLGLNGKTPPYFPDWPGALRNIFAESLHGLMFKVAPSLGAPRDVTRKLENAYFTCLAQNIRGIDAIKELNPYLVAKGISAMVFKGAALTGFPYEDPGLRPMEDIDLMARPGEERELFHVLRQAGYVRDPFFPGLFVKDGLTIDPHVHPLNADRVAARTGLLDLEPSAIFERSLPFSPGTSHVRRPSDMDHVLILAQHMVKHSFSKLIWLEDIQRLLMKQDFHFLVRLNRMIRAYGQERPIAYASYLARKIMKKPLYPTEIPISPPFVRFTRIENALLNLRVSGASMGDWGNLLWLFCLPDKRLVLRFAAQTLFPSQKALARENPGSCRQSGSLLYARRATRVLRGLLAGIPILFKAYGKSEH
ncbi:MAG: signal peptidase I [Deltaproteobacteria bacterium]|nr:signal peptidase I [Deltaproteobacteria bacterium]